MAMVETRLSALMLKNVRARMLAISNRAVPTQFQEVFTLAMAKGFIKHVKTQAITQPGIVPGFTFVAPSQGVTGVTSEAMANEAMAFFAAEYGREGQYLREYLLGIYDAMVAELAQTTNTSITGFGGDPGKIAGMDKELMAEDIKLFLPPPANTTQGSKRILRALSHGVITVMQRDGVVTTLPNVPIPPTPPTGPCIAKLT